MDAYKGTNYMKQAEAAQKMKLPDPRPTLSEVMKMPKSIRWGYLYGSVIIGDNVVPAYRSDNE